MNDEHIKQIARAAALEIIELVERIGREREAAPRSSPLAGKADEVFLVPRRLTVGQFALCAGMCPEVIRRKIRASYIKRELVEGPPYRIDRAALAKFRVPLDVAAERLRAAPARPPTRDRSRPPSRA